MPCCILLGVYIKRDIREGRVKSEMHSSIGVLFKFKSAHMIKVNCYMNKLKIHIMRLNDTQC